MQKKRPFKLDRDGHPVYRVQVLMTEEEHRRFRQFMAREGYPTEDSAARALLAQSERTRRKR